MYQHVFWDVGGTLVDTYPALDETLADVVRRRGHQVDSSKVSRLTRRSTGEAIHTLAGKFGIPAREFEDANRALKARWEHTPAPVTPGARELMRAVRAAGGLNLVVTHRDRASAQSLIRGLGLIVDDLISASDGYPRKPDPTMHLALLKRHGLDPADCLGVGDRAIDAEAAHAAGIAAAMLVSEHAPRSELAAYNVTRLNELRPHLHLGAAR